MARDEKKRQQKLMRKRQKQKRKKKRASQIAAASTDTSIIRRARHYPIHECLISRDWQENGIAVIIIARRQSESKIVCGVYMVDLYCLGVKDTSCRANLSLYEYRNDFRARFVDEGGATAGSVELAHQIIFGAIDFAASLDLPPHEDFQLSRHVLEEREDIPPNETIEFGKDGKPFYIAGPDDPVGRILKHLESRLGEDGFHFMYGEGSV